MEKKAALALTESAARAAIERSRKRTPSAMGFRRWPAQVLGLPYPLAGKRRQLGQLTGDVAQPLVGPLVAGKHGRVLRAGEQVERVALPRGPEQLLLICLAVHGHQVVSEVGKQ